VPAELPYRIPFNRPGLAGPEFEYIRKAIEEGKISGDGSFTRLCEELLGEALGVERVLLTTSCTHALEMSALLLDISPGDEVIVPSFTFVSTVNAFVMRGCRPVFADIRPDTLNIDEARLPGLVSDSTRAIVPVHYGGVGCEMDEILELCKARKLACVEDNAHGLFGSYRGRRLGSMGCLAALSFHETKSYTCGEGGALLLNDAAFVERAEIVREKGTDRSRFFRGEVDRYTWMDLGSSYVPSDVLAAFLYAQLERHESIFEARRNIWERYSSGLQDWATASGAELPFVPDHCDQAYHLFYLLMPDSRSRDALIEHLRHAGILAVFHYLPLHLSPMGMVLGGRPGQCPVTEDISERLLRLPLYNDLCLPDQEFVMDRVRAFEGV
jgi:dTDP-4-amino-4,6-dideoxygalactose transaminase